MRLPRLWRRLRRTFAAPRRARPASTAGRRLAAAAQSPLLWGVRICLVLVLLTPFVVTSATYFPFVVGKAIYLRMVIEVLVCLWAALLLLRPSCRPPRSIVLLLLGAGLLAGAAAALFGVSPTRSLWSTYERMQGLVDTAHWFAFALVAVSVLRDAAAVRALMNANLGVALVIGCLAIVGYFAGEVPFYGAPERDAPRVGSVFGNATYLGAYATVNLLLAAGFLVRSFVAKTARGDAAQTQRDRRARWLARAFWTATALVCLAALVFSGSFTALLALGGGIVFLVGAACFAHARVVRRLALGVGVLGGLAAVAVGALFFFPKAFPAIAEATLEQPLLQRLANSNVRNPSFLKRRLAWRAGIEGFVERPLLGWGPDNFVVVFGRYATGIGVKTEVHDYAHNKIIEEAATKGLVGLACHLALWGFALHVVCRAARRGAAADRVFATFVGAALTAYFVQQQMLPDSLALSMQLVLLFAFAASVETAGGRSAQRFRRGQPVPQTPSRSQKTEPSGKVNAYLRKLGIGAFAGGLVALSVWGLTTNHSIYRATTNITGFGPTRPTHERPLAHIEQALRDFEPLANSTRVRLYTEIKGKWRLIRVRRSAAARRLLALAEREGELAMEVEPQNWRIRATLAKLYCVVGVTEPGYTARAARERAKALALAPQMDTFLSWDLVLHERCEVSTEDR